MTLIEIPAEGDLPTLTIPHGPWCSPAAHVSSRPCWREVGMENVIEQHLADHFPHMKVWRQPRWGRVGRPDLVTLTRVGGVVTISVLELKTTTINRAALKQLARYVAAVSKEAADTAVPTCVTGVLVGFHFRRLDLPEWATRWPIALEA